MFTRNLVILVSSLVFASAAQAYDNKLGNIKIGDPFARATVPGQASAGAYLSLENKGKVDDELIGAKSTIASSVELHKMKMKDNVMTMRQVNDIDIDAGQKITMQPGSGYHIMLIGLKQQLKAGDKFPLTLHFEKAGEIDVVVNVEASASAAAEHQH